jgi:RNA-splicing ligase RtcB
VHSGSRHIGSQVADWYQDEAYRSLCGGSKKQIAEMIAKLKSEGREREISETVKRLKKSETDVIPKDLSYVSGELFEDYIHDMKIIQQFAVLNRKAMTEVILRGMGLTETDRFTTTHNYIDTDSRILRKGAVSAKNGERLLIPINMRDGSLICVGKGNDDWNSSAPHGAGRLMSRTAAFKALSMEDYEAEMSGIFTTSVNRKTLDEAPMAYKSMDEIISHIAPTAEIVARIRPTYNFKAGE